MGGGFRKLRGPNERCGEISVEPYPAGVDAAAPERARTRSHTQHTGEGRVPHLQV